MVFHELWPSAAYRVFDNIVKGIRFFWYCDTADNWNRTGSHMIIPASDLLFTDAQVAELVEQGERRWKISCPSTIPLCRSCCRSMWMKIWISSAITWWKAWFYKYYAFLKTEHGFDYAPDAQIILSGTEEVQDSVKLYARGNGFLSSGAFSGGISLHCFDVSQICISTAQLYEFHQFVD